MPNIPYHSLLLLSFLQYPLKLGSGKAIFPPHNDKPHHHFFIMRQRTLNFQKKRIHTVQNNENKCKFQASIHNKLDHILLGIFT